VCQVTATDWDAGENGRVYYSLPGSVASLFHVDQRGVISAHESIDRERYDKFRFPVLAVDSAAALRQTGSALVVISIDDVNDERPMFLQPTYLFTVEENQPPATLVRTGLSRLSDLYHGLHDASEYSPSAAVVHGAAESFPDENCTPDSSETNNLLQFFSKMHVYCTFYLKIKIC